MMVLSLFIGTLAVQASWSSQALQSASANASSGSNQSCVKGFNQKKPRQDAKAYQKGTGYSTQCSAGESWSKCMRRLYFGR